MIYSIRLYNYVCMCTFICIFIKEVGPVGKAECYVAQECGDIVTRMVFLMRVCVCAWMFKCEYNNHAKSFYVKVIHSDFFV